MRQDRKRLFPYRPWLKQWSPRAAPRTLGFLRQTPIHHERTPPKWRYSGARAARSPALPGPRSLPRLYQWHGFKICHSCLYFFYRFVSTVARTKSPRSVLRRSAFSSWSPPRESVTLFWWLMGFLWCKARAEVVRQVGFHLQRRCVKPGGFIALTKKGFCISV